MRYYRLDGHEAVPCDITDTSIGTQLALSEIGDYLVSTIFLGVNHSYLGRGPLKLFETMIFKDCRSIGYTRRCATWDEALDQHALAVLDVPEDGSR